MTHPTDPRLKRLKELAEVSKMARLARLAEAVSARERALGLLQGLSNRTVEDKALPEILAGIRHQRWAEARRVALSEELLRLEAKIQSERSAAAKAVARCELLGKIAGRNGRGQLS